MQQTCYQLPACIRHMVALARCLVLPRARGCCMYTVDLLEQQTHMGAHYQPHPLLAALHVA
jgi:hypothetical protein